MRRSPYVAAGLAAATLAGPVSAGQPQAAAPQPPVPQHLPYVGGFCLRVAAGVTEGPEYYHLLAAAGARPQDGAAGQAAAPVDQPVAGQAFRFEGAPADAPTAFVDPRRGTCALVWEGAALPAAAVAELVDDRPKSGPDGTAERWRKVSPVFVIRPRPPRWFLQVGAADGQGACADALTDLRRRDGAVVSMLRLSPCRPGRGGQGRGAVIVAAALAAGLSAAAPRSRAYTPPSAYARAAPSSDSRAWALRVAGWLDTGLRLCTDARSPVGLDAAAYRAGAVRALAPRIDARYATPAWLLGPRGEVQVSATGGRDGLRCTVSAVSGDAGPLQADLPRRAAALGFARTPTAPARWPGEAAWRGRGGPAAGAYLATAAPFVHGAPYGALLVVSRGAAR